MAHHTSHNWRFSLSPDKKMLNFINTVVRNQFLLLFREQKSFKKQLKTHLFASAFPSMRLWFDVFHLFIYLVVFDFVRA